MEWISIFLFSLGFLFTFSGVVGVLRLPDFFSRLHAVGKSDTLGVILMLLALAIQSGTWLNAAKITLISIFISLASPLATHALARAAYRAGLQPWKRKREKKDT